MSGQRLSAPQTEGTMERILRDAPLSFTFNGKRLQGFVGDTLASALLANGESLFCRSWKYHRPRGVVTSGVEEPSALVQLETGPHTIPNAKLPEIELYEDLQATSVHPWPGQIAANLSINSRFSRLFPAGFYYKTFMWPAKAWMWYEKIIRKAGGLGEVPTVEDTSTYLHQNHYCDVLIIGGGVVGLAAALAAAQKDPVTGRGARVTLVELAPELGGSAHRQDGLVNGKAASLWVNEASATLRAMDNVKVLTRSVAFGMYDGNFVTVRESLADHLPIAQRGPVREMLWRIRAQEVILATGAHERPVLFGNNDLPGVMLSSAIVDYALLYGVLVGSNIVLVTNNDSAYVDALHLMQRAGAAGLRLQIVDSRAQGAASELQEAARITGVTLYLGMAPLQAQGGVHIESLTIAPQQNGRAQSHGQIVLRCDALGMAGGWNPAVHLYSYAMGRVAWQESTQCFAPSSQIAHCVSVGACAADFDLASSLKAAITAGSQAAQACGFAVSGPALEARARAQNPIDHFWLAETQRPNSRRAKAFVDYQNDVAVSDIELAIREGFQSIEHIKRYTAMGFGTDQGKLGNINGMAVAAKTLQLPIEKVGTTTFRPNYVPISFGLFAGLERGDLFDPVRTTSPHAHHLASGCLFEDVGQWKRPWYFPKAGEDIHAAVEREVLAVRSSVGLFDASTLGKIDIQGPDAATLLNWVYCNAWSKLAVGKCRYGLMLDENGMVFDDGVTTRLAENHFLMTTTTGGAARVLNWLERWVQTEWPELRVYMSSVTDQWSTFALAGPNSRKVLAKVLEGADISAEALPFMSYCAARVAGIAARVMRISFSGELAFEINIPARHGLAVWEALLKAGEEFDITRYGTETMHVLRAEKGYIIVGQDTDGSVTPDDLGLGGMVSKTKPFIGDRSLARSDTAREGRKQLVGLLSLDPQFVIPEGAQLTELSQVNATTSHPAIVPMIGHVSSSYYSPTLKRSIALALVKGGRARMGQTIYVAMPDGACVPAQVGSSVFYDPEGLRHKD